MNERDTRLNDRASDNWAMMFRIAALAGGEWPERAQRAALATQAGDAQFHVTDNVRVLADIRKVFVETGFKSMPAAELVNRLCAIEDGPWREYKGNRSISTRGLANLLSPFGIATEKLTDANHYFRRAFEDAWKRYL